MREKKIPEVRFQGFTDDWEQQTLGNILITLPFKPYMKLPEQNGKYEIIQQGNEPIAGYANGSPCSNYTDLVIFGDHTLSLFKPESPFFVATDGVRILKGKDNMNRNYLYVLLQKYKPESEGYKRYYSILAKCKIWLTMNSNEQNRTGILFATLDNLIALHQRKLTNLKLLKKSMLTKMFPKDGSRVPEIRFQGFQGDWKESKFFEIAQRESNTRLSSSDFPSVEYEDVVSEAGILNKNISEKSTQKTGITFDRSHILYGKLRPYLHNWLNPDFYGVAVGDWWVLKPIEADTNFLYRLIQTPEFDNAANQSTGSKMPRADWNHVAKTTFMIPTNSTEQRKIGIYFNSIDKLIAFHQRKLSKLQQIKQAMLSKLFV